MTIKCKVWHKTWGKMYTVKTLHFNPDSGELLLIGLAYRGITLRPEEVELLMSTNLCDRNLVEVYDGFKLSDTDDWNDGYVYFLVEWNEDLLKFEINGYGYRTYTGENSQEVDGTSIELIDRDVIELKEIKNMKVIGNIYEN